MTIRTYNVFTFLSSLIYSALFFLSVVMINPFQAGVFGFLYFYLGLFGFLYGFVYLVAFLVHKKFFHKLSGYKHVKVVTRHAILFSVLFTVTLWLLSLGILNIINVLLLIFILTFMELFFMSKKERVSKEG